MDIVGQVLQGDRRALARAISLVENGAPETREIMKRVYLHTGRAHVIGITGAPGVGKSTLVDRLTQEFRNRGKTVGIIAVDPTSPFTGGAILGDRIRMQGRSSDEGVFIRSMATRGHLGGLSRATGDIIRLMDAAGKDRIIVETVGAGQSEVDIMRYAHTTVLVLVPGLGDDIQVIKAGILEIGNVFVVNKADREGADRTVMELQMMLELNPQKTGWKPPIVRTIARDGQGTVELVDVIEKHRLYLEESGLLVSVIKEQTRTAVREIVANELARSLWEKARSNGGLENLLDKVASRELDPYTAAERIMRKYGNCLVEF